jgi:hypothetical protein
MLGVKSITQPILHRIEADFVQEINPGGEQLYTFTLPNSSYIKEVVFVDMSRPNHRVNTNFTIGDRSIINNYIMTNVSTPVGIRVWDGGLIRCLVNIRLKHMVIYYET